MSILLTLDTLKELSRLITQELRSQGHTRTAEYLYKSFSFFETRYSASYSSHNEAILVNFNTEIVKIIKMPRKSKIETSQLDRLSERLQEETKRLIFMQQHKDINIKKVFED